MHALKLLLTFLQNIVIKSASNFQKITQYELKNILQFLKFLILIINSVVTLWLSFSVSNFPGTYYNTALYNALLQL